MSDDVQTDTGTGHTERTGPLLSPLPLCYGDQSSFPGIVVLGRLDGDAAARIAELDGSVTAIVGAG